MLLYQIQILKPCFVACSSDFLNFIFLLNFYKLFLFLFSNLFFIFFLIIFFPQLFLFLYYNLLQPFF